MSIAGRLRDLRFIPIALLGCAACAASAPQLRAELQDVEATLGVVSEGAAAPATAFDGSLEGYTHLRL